LFSLRFKSQPMVPLRPEYGGDGRTPADALAEAEARVGQPNMTKDKAAADKIKAALAP
jgi:hypothetical protein